jgi:hypothetical protein
MNSFAQKVLTMISDDPEAVMAAASGSIADSILHPRTLKKIIPHILKAAVVGFFLAEFISPAIAEKLELSRRQAIALSFVCGFAGIKLLRAGENLIEKRIQLMGGTEGISTLSSKPSEDEDAGASD